MLWSNQDRRREVWLLAPTGGIVASFNADFYNSDPVAIAVGPDNKVRMLSMRDDGQAVIRRLTVDGSSSEVAYTYGPFAGWRAVDVAVGADGKTRVLWSRTDGQIALWVLDANNNLEVNSTHGPFDQWRAKSISVSPDGKFRVLWVHPNGLASPWVTNFYGGREVVATYGPYPEPAGTWMPEDMTVGSDGKSRMLWSLSNSASVWTTDALLNRETVTAGIPLNNSLRPYALGLTPSSLMRVLWTNPQGQGTVTSISNGGALSERFDYNVVPAQFQASSLENSGMVRLAWQGNPTATRYNVYRYEQWANNGFGGFVLLAQVSGTEYYDYNVAGRPVDLYPNTTAIFTYYYRVTSFTGTSAGGAVGIESTSTPVATVQVIYTNYGSGSTGAPSPPSDTQDPAASAPPAPSDLAAAGSVRRISLTWSASSGATSYIIERSVSGGQFTPLVTVAGTSTSYSDTSPSLSAGTTYTYRVTAVGSGGRRSNPSNEANAAPSQSVRDS